MGSSWTPDTTLAVGGRGADNPDCRFLQRRISHAQRRSATAVHLMQRAAITVPCHVSERWLQFAEREQYAVLDEDLIQLDVMTLDDEGAHYKLCELMVSRGDLLRAVAAYGDPPFRRAPVRKDGTRVDTDNAAAGRSAAARTGRTRRPARPDTEQTEL
jgi:hypothetical protein